MKQLNHLYLGHRMKRPLPWWWILAAFFVGFMVRPDHLERAYDKWIDRQTWFYVSLEIVPEEYGPPSVIYDYSASRLLKGTWTAYAQAKPRAGENEGRRLLSRKGGGDYSPSRSGPKPWTWADFFDDRRGLPPPAEPIEPYRLCSFYDLRTTSGVARSFGPFCSGYHNPEG